MRSLTLTPPTASLGDMRTTPGSRGSRELGREVPSALCGAVTAAAARAEGSSGAGRAGRWLGHAHSSSRGFSRTVPVAASAGLEADHRNAGKRLSTLHGRRHGPS